MVFRNFRARGVLTALAAALAACSSAAHAAQVKMFRDPGCGCCLEWAKHVEHGLASPVSTVDDVPMAQVKTENGVPGDLLACHTAIVDGYVIEGHVPADAIRKLLDEKPAGVRGLAVAGMPLGSPGMEAGAHKQPYEVIAFGPEGRYVFARY